MFFDDDDDDTENPKEWRRIVWGLFGAAFSAYMAQRCFTSVEAPWPFNREFGPAFMVRGDGAFAVGLTFVFVAVWFHFHYFWAYFPRLEVIRWLVTRISLAGFLITMLMLLFYGPLHPKPPANYKKELPPTPPPLRDGAR